MIRPLFITLSALLFLGATQPEVKESVRIRSFQGSGIGAYLSELVPLIHKIYREFPYLYEGTSEEYTTSLSAYQQTKSIVCVAFKGKEAVGIGAGMPMVHAREAYKKPLLKHNYALDKLFYLGEFGLEAKYQGFGVEEVMYKEIESFALQSEVYDTLCVWEIDNVEPKKTPGYVPTEEFWIKQGFTHHAELSLEISWREVGSQKESSHRASYWLKKIR